MGEGKWKQASWTLAGPRCCGCAVAVSDTEFVYLGGMVPGGRSRDVTKYDVLNGTATTLAKLPQSLSGFACSFKNGSIIVSGGHADRPGGGTDVLNKKVWKLETLESSSWTNMPSLQQGRGDHSMVDVDGTLYVIGGWQYRGERFMSIEWLHPSSSAWITLPGTIQTELVAGTALVL